MLTTVRRRVFAAIVAAAALATAAVGSGRAQTREPVEPPASVTTVNAVRSTVTLGGGRAVTGAQGVALDPSTGLVYIGLNGSIVGGCPGDPTSGGSLIPGPGAGQVSIVDPAQSREVAAVASGGGTVWPTADPDRRVVYVANSGVGTVTVHDAASGAKLSTIAVGGKPHMGGLDYSTRKMVVSNTVRAATAAADQIYASVVDTSSNTIVREYATTPAPHGMAVDQDRDLIYYSGVVTGEIVVVNASTGLVLTSGDPNSAYGAAFGNNNMLVRQAATRRLFQANSQPNYVGTIVVDEVTLAAEGVIRFNNPAQNVWGMWVDEPNRLLFAALPLANAIGVADLDTLQHVATIPVGTCPYAVAVDPVRHIGVTSNQGSPTENATASIIDLCPVYAAANRTVSGCSTTSTFGPTNLLGLADGSGLALAWRNVGTAATLTLNVTGTVTTSVPLSDTAESFQYSGVPPGTYGFSVAARNSAGETATSGTVTLTFPGSCAAPQSPANVVAVASGRTITVTWDPPSAGAAPTSYVISVTGAYVGTVPSTSRSIRGTVGPGSYSLSVAAANRCGTSAGSSAQTVVVS